MSRLVDVAEQFVVRWFEVTVVVGVGLAGIGLGMRWIVQLIRHRYFPYR